MDTWIVVPTKTSSGTDEARKATSSTRPVSAVADRGRSTRVLTRSAGRARSVDSDDNVLIGRSRRRPRANLASSAHRPSPKSAAASSARSSGSVGGFPLTSAARSARVGSTAEHRTRPPAHGISAVLSNPALLPWFYPLGGSVFVGRKPKSLKELAVLKKKRITAIVSVVQPHEHEVSPEQIKALGFSHMEISVREGEPLSLKQLLDGIRFLRVMVEARCGTVYVHCRLGRVRCVMLATAYLMAVQGLDPCEAEEVVTTCVPCGKLRRKHRETLAALARLLRAHAANDSFTIL
mmetsp:Transcript_50726/g.101343  ORF Transcript_50726/g.101343 Transcript_50726/m.101343 type:complete len:293 (+) Transcript_50726:39-917(+)